MSNAPIYEGEIRTNDVTYYKVVKKVKNSVFCNTRNGPRGRFSKKEVKIKISDFLKLRPSKPIVNIKSDDKKQLPKDIPIETTLLLRENRRLKRKLLHGRGVEDIIVESVRHVMKGGFTISTPPKPRLPSSNYQEIAVLHVSDTQIGKRTESYDHIVAAQRLMLLGNKTVEVTNMHRAAAQIDEIRVYLGGDMVEGNEIFPTQQNHISLDLIDQATKEGPEMIANLLLFLMKHFKKVKVVCVPGNHGRATRADPAASEKTNWDRVLYRVVEFMLSDAVKKGRCEFDISDTFWAVDEIWDWNNLCIHGHQITGGFAGMPWYGVSKKLTGYIDSIPKPFDYLWFGHFHTYASAVINHRIFLCNGTTESGNVYAQERLAACGHPCQRLAFFNKAHGLVSDNQIFLAERIPTKKRAELWNQTTTTS